MTRVMYDSTNVADDPLGADLVAYYIDGVYATTAAKVRQRFPSAVLVPISAIGSNAGIVGDVEPGCMTIQQAISWVQQRRAAGVDPSLYVNETYGWLAAREAFTRAQVAAPHWWVADYDNVPAIPDGAVAKQYENPPLTHGHFDRSVVADHWPGVDGLAGGATGHLVGGKRTMLIAQDPSDSFHYLLSAGPGAAGGGWGLYKSLLSQPALDVLRLYGVPEQNVSPTVLASIPDYPKPASASSEAPEPRTLTIAGPITGTLS